MFLSCPPRSERLASVLGQRGRPPPVKIAKKREERKEEKGREERKEEEREERKRGKGREKT